MSWQANSQKDIVYRSADLEQLWPYGFSSVGAVTFQSAAYVARYIMKKITGPAADDHYQIIDDMTGEVYDRLPEYTTMSRRPGIATGWINKYTTDIYPSDFVIIKGKKQRPPRFYDTYFEHEYPKEYQVMKIRRKKATAKHASNNTPERLKVRETIQALKLDLLKREQI